MTRVPTGPGVVRICGAVAVMSVLTAACSGSSRPAAISGTSPTSASSSRPSSTTAPPAPGCTHQPVAHVSDSYYGLRPPGGTSIDYLAAHAFVPTNDGHGDAVRNDDLSVEETRPDGTVTLTHGDTHDEVVLRGIGDFDGDDRTDLLVDVYENGTDVATYIVGGTVGTGTHDPAAVGKRVPQPRVAAGDLAAVPAPVGDQNHDGADDVSFGPALYSGRQLTHAATGAALPAPFRVLATSYVGLLQLDPQAPPVFVLPDLDTASLRVLDARSDELALPDAAALTSALANGARAAGWLVNGHHIVELSDSTRSGETAWRWDLDAACGAR